MKNEKPESTGGEGNDDHDTVATNKTIVHQESNVSSKLSSSSKFENKNHNNLLSMERTLSKFYIFLVSSDPWKKQLSKESINSVSRNNDSTATVSNEESNVEEEKIISATAPPSVNASPNLVHRNLSMTSSAGEAKLGRIQLTLRYNISRQRLTILVHQIA